MWLSGLAARYHAWISGIVEGETDEGHAYAAQLYYPWHLVTGFFWDLRKPSGQIMTFLTHLIINPLFFVHFYIAYETIVRAFDWRIDFSLQMLMVYSIGVVDYLIFLMPIFNRKRRVELHTMMFRGFFDYDLEIRRKCEETKKRHQFILRLFPLFPMSMCSQIFLFLFFKPTADTRYVNGLDLAMLIPLYYPFKIEGWPFFVLMNLVQLWVLSIVILYTSFGVYVIVFLLMQWVYQMERLIDSLNAIEERALHRLSRVVGWSGRGLDKYELYHDKDFVKSYNECLKENIQHHVLLNRFLQLLQRTSQVPLFASFACGSVMLAAMLSVLSMEDMEMGAKLWTGVMLLLSLSGFSVCILGQKINDIAEELREAIYNLDWFAGDIDIQRNFVILMEITQKPIKPVLFTIFSYDLNGFTKVINGAYTYYNLILMSRGMEMDVL